MRPSCDERTERVVVFGDHWLGSRDDEAGWFWSTEKKAALDDTYFENYKGAAAEVRFWVGGRGGRR